MGCSSSKESPHEAGTSPQDVLMKMLSPPVEGIQNFLHLNQTAKPAMEGVRHLRNVFAVPLEVLLSPRFQPPEYPKSKEEEDVLHLALQKNYIFENLSPTQLAPLVKAFEKKQVAAGEVIIQQGSTQGDYFYVLYKGKCTFEVNDIPVGTALPGDSFGELALLFNAPRAATVKAAEIAIEPCTLFRVDQKSFRFILKQLTDEGASSKKSLLDSVSVLKDLDHASKTKIAAVMTPRPFEKGEQILKKGDAVTSLMIVQSGEVLVQDISIGETKYENIVLKAGESIGEGMLRGGVPNVGDIIAQTDGMLFTIDKSTFERVLGKLDHLIVRSTDKRVLNAIKILKDTQLDGKTLDFLVGTIVNTNYKAGTKITIEGKSTEAALYLVRRGKIQVTNDAWIGRRNDTIVGGGFFGDDQLMVDAESGDSNGPSTTVTKYTALVVEDCVCGVLTLASCRMAFNTVAIGSRQGVMLQKIAIKDLQRHRILGAGTFGQVWLVSRKDDGGMQVPYALKVQSKYELCEDGQAAGVVNEKNALAQLQSPFTIGLVAAFQDATFVYMLLTLLQGGELDIVMNTSKSGSIGHERVAKFYVAGISQGISFMHRQGYVYRDLKPENVLLDGRGYPVIIDFGFVKQIKDRTFTFCGTPLYMAPEIILNRGHTWAVDHWSLGVLAYEMFTGETPFYTRNMTQAELYRAIVKGNFSMPPSMSREMQSLISGLLTRVYHKRLGSLAGGEEDILKHPWFAGLDTEKMRRREMTAPFIPSIKNPLDSSNFRDWSHADDKTKKTFPKLTRDQEKIFEGF